MSTYCFGTTSSYYESKKQQGLILTRKHLCPTDDLAAIDKKGNPVTGRDGLPQWDREKGRYRTFAEQQEAIKKYDTSRTLPPNSIRAEKEIDRIIEKQAAIVAALRLPDDPAA